MSDSSRGNRAKFFLFVITYRGRSMCVRMWDGGARGPGTLAQAGGAVAAILPASV